MRSNIDLPELSLPDQDPNPDWSEVRYHADSLLEVCITRPEDDDKDERDLIYLIAENVLRALYGPHVDDLVRELRERYGPEN